MAEEAYQRILLKLSGEALLGQEDYGIDPEIIQRIAVEVGEVTQLGIQVAIVIGGGNIFRGAGLAKSGIDRVTGDHMGMLATVMNSLALQDALEKLGAEMIGDRLNFRDPWGNRVEVVPYDDIQFTKAPEVLKAMGLDRLEKTENARDELAKKGMAPD